VLVFIVLWFVFVEEYFLSFFAILSYIKVYNSMRQEYY